MFHKLELYSGLEISLETWCLILSFFEQCLYPFRKFINVVILRQFDLPALSAAINIVIIAFIIMVLFDFQHLYVRLWKLSLLRQ